MGHEEVSMSNDFKVLIKDSQDKLLNLTQQYMDIEGISRASAWMKAWTKVKGELHEQKNQTQ